jgi:hypothetical protein
MHFSTAWHYLKIFARWTMIALLAASVFRLILWLGFYSKKATLSLDLLAAFVSGLRFDLLVYGFFWLPFLFAIWLLCFFKKTDWLYNFGRSYWMIAQTYFILFILAEIFFVAARGHRLNSQFANLQPSELFPVAFQNENPFLLLFVLAATTIAIIWVYRKLLNIQPQNWVPQRDLSGIRQLALVILSFLIAGLAARGTVRAHHLRYEDALVSENPQINQIPLNPVWSQDKDMSFEVSHD